MYELDIKNYNEIELLDVLGIPEPLETLTREDILEKVNDKKRAIEKSKNQEKTGVDELMDFFNNAGNKLLSYVVRRTPVQLPPTNYDVLQSRNQLSGENHAVTTEKVVPPLNVSEYKYPAGVINPIEKRTTTKIINIDSLFRDNYESTSSNNFTWVLSSSENKVVSMKLVSVELPIMWYDITDRDRSNEIIIVTKNAKKYNYVEKRHVLKIPPGNYNNEEMQLMLNRIFQTEQDGLEYLIATIDSYTSLTTIRARDATDGSQNQDDGTSEYNPTVYTQSDSENYSPNFTFQLIFYSDRNDTGSKTCEPDVDCKTYVEPPIDRRLDELSFKKTVGWYLGFRKQNYLVSESNTISSRFNTNIDNHIYAGAVTSESSFGGGKGHYIYISVDDFNRNCPTETISSYSGNVFIANNILGRISLNVPTQDILINQPSDKVFKQRDYMGPVTLNKFKVSLLDKFGDLIDLKKNDFSLALELTILY
tara:strand:- start:870 stop:2303 length:1434 start_codon:yes stop_codon:yes gene_type:complete